MTPRGYFYIAGAVLLVGIIARNITLVSVGLLAGLLLGAAWVWQRFCLTGVEYTRRFSEDHVFWGETVTLTVSLMNRKPLPLSWIETDEEFPKQLEFLDYETEAVGALGRVGLGHTTALRWFERVSWRYQIRCENRGL